jgi:DNA-binding transcriptional MerR regulator
MSDDELLAYWNKAQAEGYSLNQIKTLARAQGASESDISKFEKRIKSLKDKDKEPEVSSTEETLSSIFGINATDKLDDVDDTNEAICIHYQFLEWSFLNQIQIHQLQTLLLNSTSPLLQLINLDQEMKFQLAFGEGQKTNIMQL